LDEEEIRTVLGALQPFVEQKKVKDGIMVRPLNQQTLERIVKMPPGVRDKVWDWFHEPKVFEDSEEWKRIREPLTAVFLEALNIMLNYGPSSNRELFRSALEELLKNREHEKT